MDSIPFVDEQIRLLARLGLVDTPVIIRKYDYICGLLDAYARVATGGTESIDAGWKSLAQVTSNRLQLKAYWALGDKVEDTPRALEHYSTDLHKIDFQGIMDNPEDSFVWILRDSGTHITWTKYSNWKDHVKTGLRNDCLYIGYWDAIQSTLIDLNISTWEAEIDSYLDN
jgi:hypothetical protein